MTLIQFIENDKGIRNMWVREKGFSSLYVRLCRRYIHGNVVSNVLDIASVEASKPGNGAFTKLIERIRKRYPYLTIYIENVLNPRFAVKIMHLGFQRDNTTPDELPSYFKPAPKEQ